MRRSCKIAAAAVVLSAAAVTGFFWLRPPAAGAIRRATAEEFRYRPLKTLLAHIAMLEKPDACRVLLLGETSEQYRMFFEHARLKCLANDESGRYDIVFVGGRCNRPWEKIAAQISSSGVLAWAIDVENLQAAEFKEMLESFPCEQTHLWMPGEKEWLLVGRMKAARLKLDTMLELFSDEKAFLDLARANCQSLPELFASYVGTREQVLPAFVGDLSQTVRPEAFVSRDIPEIGWLVQGGLDEDIFAAVRAEIRSMQLVRRMVLEGNIFSETADGMEKALDMWAAAVRRNPRDSMMLERLYRLAVNAKAFQNVGNLKGAAKCYETMIAVRPKDAAALQAYADVMKVLGHPEIAAQAEKKAREVLK